MIYLIGVNHDQAARNICGQDLTDCQQQFQSVVESAIESIHPDLLAEEDHPDWLLKAKSESILLAIANKNQPRIGHIFVDPNDCGRKAIGYKRWEQIIGLKEINSLLIQDNNERELDNLARAHEIAHQFPIREQFWLAALRRKAANNILFVCGDIHIYTFTSLLANERIAFSVFVKGIGVNSSNNVEYNALTYAQNNNMFGITDCFCLKS